MDKFGRFTLIASIIGLIADIITVSLFVISIGHISDLRARIDLTLWLSFIIYCLWFALSWLILRKYFKRMFLVEIRRFKEHERHLFEDIPIEALELYPPDLKRDWELQWLSIKSRYSHAPRIIVLATSVLIVPLFFVHFVAGTITLLVGLLLNPFIAKGVMPMIYKDMIDLGPE